MGNKMKKLAAYCSATILLWTIFASGALAATKLFGPEKSDNDTLPINIKAVQLSYDNKGENLTAKGNVEIEQGSRLLKADFVKINIETKDTEAKGHVELNENGDILSCDAFNINLDTQMGHVENAVLFVKQDNLHITGKDISKLGANTYEIKQGTITTCDSESPPWRIDAKKINVTIDGYATVQGSVFRIKKIPVAYLPFAVVPVKTTRQSGFLFPEISQSSRKGVEVNNSFYWAMSENTDSTIWLDAASKKGLGTGLEYRFKLKEDSWGKMYGYFADETSNYFDDEYSDPQGRKRQRGYLNFEGEHYFNQDAYVKAQGSYITDREFYDDYRSEVRRSKNQTADKTDIGSQPYDESLVFFNKNWESSNLLVKTEYYRNLNNSDRSISQPLPQVAFSTMRLPLSGSPFFYQFDTAYDYFYRQEGVKGNRFDVYPKISLPLCHDGWLKLDTAVGVRAVAFKGIKNNDRNNVDSGSGSRSSWSFISGDKKRMTGATILSFFLRLIQSCRPILFVSFLLTAKFCKKCAIRFHRHFFINIPPMMTRTILRISMCLKTSTGFTALAIISKIVLPDSSTRQQGTMRKTNSDIF